MKQPSIIRGMKYQIKEETTLLAALAVMSPQSSKTTLRSWLSLGRVTVDGEPVKLGAELLAVGQEVALGVRPRFLRNEVKIYYEDKDIIVVEKPSGLLSVATAFEKGETMHAYLKEQYENTVYVVHRLDQETSGVMLFALSAPACDQLKITFEQHDIERIYYAIVEGKVEKDEGTWESYLYEDPNYFVRKTDDPEKGRLATTHYSVRDRSKNYTALNLKLQTGRKNQIRVHCNDAGHPVVGDKKYGATSDPIKRLCLHAQYLAFLHPITKKEMKFESVLPEVFKKVMPKQETLRYKKHF